MDCCEELLQNVSSKWWAGGSAQRDVLRAMNGSNVCHTTVVEAARLTGCTLLQLKKTKKNNLTSVFDVTIGCLNVSFLLNSLEASPSSALSALDVLSAGAEILLPDTRPLVLRHGVRQRRGGKPL